MDPLANSSWSRASTVEGFRRGEPNPVLIDYAARLRRERGAHLAADIGCGAGRNAIPLARAGWTVVGVDLSAPMLAAARERADEESLTDRACFVMSPMTALPLRSGSADLVVAHGIWNLARSAAQFRAAVHEGARIARPGAALFVFTFSRNTLPPEAKPVAGEPFTFTQFSGEPQCLVTAEQLMDEMAAAGFLRDPAVAFSEYNRPRSGQLPGMTGPVIYEAAFVRQ